MRAAAAIAAALFACCALAQDAPAAKPEPVVTLDRGLGSLRHPVSTRNRQAQAYFDQGLKLVFAFNHAAAVRSFQRAAELDPDLAMAYWGIALALGPNINQPMSAEAHAQAFAALQKATALAPKASRADRDYIAALATRYNGRPDAVIGQLSAAYKDAMAAFVRRYRDDNDAAVLYAESLMDLRPWHLWTAHGKPEEGTGEIVATLECVLRRDPAHIGANHYYIHAVEASPHPEKALPSAKRLEMLAPSAGHLVHMPAHVYIRTGRYLEAAAINERAARADERLIASGNRSLYLVGYYGHNLHFIAVNQAIAGHYGRALAAANKLAAYETPRIKEVPFVDGFLLTPALVMLEFGRWDDVLALPEPPFEAPVSGTFWHFARAIAYAAKGRMDDAQGERDKFNTAAAALPKTLELGNNDAKGVLAVATPYLEGRMALFRGDTAAAVDSLKQAVTAEDALSYDEPAGWLLPTRLALGVALLRTGDSTGAEQAFAGELKRNPESGRALFGFSLALAAQKRDVEAARVQHRFHRAWRGADTKLDASVL